MAPDDQHRGRCGVTPLRPQPATAAATPGEAWAVTVCAEPAATGADRPVACAVDTGDVTYWLDGGLEHVELEVNLVLADGMVWAIAEPQPQPQPQPQPPPPPPPQGEPAASGQFFRHELQARTADARHSMAGEPGTPRSTLRLRISAHRVSPPPPGAERAGHTELRLPPGRPGQPAAARPARELGIAGLATAS